MDRSRLTPSSKDELGQIRVDIRVCNSLDAVRRSFERLQEIRRQHLDDFELQIVIADVQQEIIERARFLRKQAETGSTAKLEPEAPATVPKPDLELQVAEIPPDIPKLNQKSWQVAIGLAVLLTVGVFASFFYLIQAARRLNIVDESQPAATAAVPPPPLRTTAVSNPDPSPTLRLYTDLVGGTATVDDQPARDLVDGELNLDALTAGTHKVRVESRSGSADFSFALDGEKDVPRVTEILKSNNAMVVLVSVKDGTGRLNTDAAGANVVMDDKPLGPVAADGLLLLDLGKQDHSLEVSQARDKQKFVLTYTPAPTLTVFVKSDPSTGVLTVSTGQDGVSVFINDLLYKRVTEHGEVRIPLKVGTYRIRVHRVGFQDPAALDVQVKKNSEAAVQFHLQPALDVGTLQIKGAQPGTIAYVDKQMAATVGADGTAKITNVKPGDRMVELRHDLAIPKQLTRTFTAGGTVTLAGADTVLDHFGADNKSIIPANPGPAALAPPEVPPLQPAAVASAVGEQVHKGGGFIAYHTPRLPGRYYFEAHAKLGGILKHGKKLQWYAGYQDSNNYVLFTLDGKHAEVKEFRDGKSFDLGKIPFNLASDQWVQIEMSIKPDSLQARAKAGIDDWIPLTPVGTAGRDFTKETVGVFVPSNEEVAVANFRFSGK